MVENTVLAKFCRATGFKESDILSHNPKTLTFVSRFGGKYQIRNNKVLTLVGPPFPKQRPVADEGGTE